MIQYFKNIDHKTVAVDRPEPGVWINVLPPLKQEEFSELSASMDIPLDFLSDSLDIDERSRFEEDDNVKLIVIKTPAENNSFSEIDAFYITIPICIILTHNQIITVNSFENGAIKKFLNTFQNRHPDNRKMMVLKIFEKITQTYMDSLKEINQRRNAVEQKLFTSNSHPDLLELMKIQKSLIYFVTALRSNELLLMKIVRTNFLGLNDFEKELLEDLVVDISQGLEMAHTSSNILNCTLNAFNSVIHINTNSIQKTIAALLILFSLPLLVTTVYGMNLPLPFNKSAHTFYIVVTIATVISIIFSRLFMKKKWF